MGLLDKLTASLRGLKPKGAEAEAAEEAEYQERREAAYRETIEQFTDADHIKPKPYNDLSVGEAKAARTPAIEYFHSTGAIRLHNLLTMDQMNMASLIIAYAMQLDDLPEGEAGDLIDVKPVDMAAIEHGAVNLGPAPEFKNAQGTQWRLFVELSYSAAAGAGRGAILTRRYVVDTTLQ